MLEWLIIKTKNSTKVQRKICKDIRKLYLLFQTTKSLYSYLSRTNDPSPLQNTQSLSPRFQIKVGLNIRIFTLVKLWCCVFIRPLPDLNSNYLTSTKKCQFSENNVAFLHDVGERSTFFPIMCRKNGFDPYLTTFVDYFIIVDLFYSTKLWKEASPFLEILRLFLRLHGRFMSLAHYHFLNFKSFWWNVLHSYLFQHCRFCSNLKGIKIFPRTGFPLGS